MAAVTDFRICIFTKVIFVRFFTRQDLKPHSQRFMIRSDHPQRWVVVNIIGNCFPPLWPLDRKKLLFSTADTQVWDQSFNIIVNSGVRTRSDGLHSEYCSRL